MLKRPVATMFRPLFAFLTVPRYSGSIYTMGTCVSRPGVLLSRRVGRSPPRVTQYQHRGFVTTMPRSNRTNARQRPNKPTALLRESDGAVERLVYGDDMPRNTTADVVRGWNVFERRLAPVPQDELDEDNGDVGGSSFHHAKKEKTFIEWLAGSSAIRFYLPQGFPRSVSRDYLPYQSWLFIQNSASSAGYVLSTHSLLSAIGIGTGSALPLAAAISWVLKDGLGCIGQMIVANRFASRFDDDTKRTKWFAALLNNFGVAMEISTPMFPGYFVVVASLANTAKAIAGLIGGATKATINQNMALATNLGDVTAKAHSQAVASYLGGMSVGIGASIACHHAAETCSLSTPLPFIFGMFGILSMVNLYSSYRGLSNVSLRSLNSQRAYLVTCEYLKIRDPSVPGSQLTTLSSPSGTVFAVPTPFAVSKNEVFISTSRSLLWKRVRMGVSITDCVPVSTEHLRAVLSLFKRDKYLLLPASEGAVGVVLHEGAIAKDSLRAFFHAQVFLKITATRSQVDGGDACVEKELRASLRYVEDHFDLFHEELGRAGWETDEVLLLMGARKNRATW
eukprot:TRINITY_DN5885_c0_g1_i1.p1 TRINITY_DN5885_c0_g1~~TRINITY_DN5885_c0_g1_i1.p1  ORF type:complete len:565 (+),score=57.59 TRINITY_DN5885_c0_g1_i1:152-1846(+)